MEYVRIISPFKNAKERIVNFFLFIILWTYC